MSFIVFLLLNFYILLSLYRVSAESDGLMIFLLTPSQVTGRNYIFRVSVYVVYTNFFFVQLLINKLPELIDGTSYCVCLKRWQHNYVMQKPNK